MADTKLKASFKVMIALVAISLCFIASHAFATPVSGGLATISDNIKGTFGDLAKLITAAAYVAGFGFAFAAILKFKAHKDNPTQIPVGTPIALLFIAAALIFLPSIFGVAGKTIFGSSEHVGGVSGVSGVPGISGNQ